LDHAHLDHIGFGKHATCPTQVFRGVLPDLEFHLLFRNLIRKQANACLHLEYLAQAPYGHQTPSVLGHRLLCGRPPFSDTLATHRFSLCTYRFTRSRWLTRFWSCRVPVVYLPVHRLTLRVFAPLFCVPPVNLWVH